MTTPEHIHKLLPADPWTTSHRASEKERDEQTRTSFILSTPLPPIPSLAQTENRPPAPVLRLPLQLYRVSHYRTRGQQKRGMRPLPQPRRPLRETSPARKSHRCDNFSRGRRLKQRLCSPRGRYRGLTTGRGNRDCYSEQV